MINSYKYWFNISYEWDNKNIRSSSGSGLVQV